MDFVIKKNSLLSVLDLQLLDTSGDPVDLTTATGARLYMRDLAQDTLKLNNAAMSVVSPATNGTVRYEWVAGDTDTVGVYALEVVVTWSSGKTQKFPADDDDNPLLEVAEDLA